MPKLGETRNQQGRLSCKMESLGFDLQNEAVLNTLTLDVIQSSKWAKINKCVQDSALRDIQDFMKKDILQKEAGGGRGGKRGGGAGGYGGGGGGGRRW